ncbi:MULTISPECIES: hypothetical protein [unclassified Aeromicrobium]|jgi:hypothetical protein|uniref:hypothetical protein n=1 Tax=unclassified Aeromicrobium TaxID=2633570 RepID=UPI000A9B4610|nr:MULTISPECIES: hypothetical protein [unclassified Aeromicrobium]
MHGSTNRGGPNTRAAAADALASSYQAWADTAAGKRVQLSTRREARRRNRGTTMVVYGEVAISADLRNDGTRSTAVDISRVP